MEPSLSQQPSLSQPLPPPARQQRRPHACVCHDMTSVPQVEAFYDTVVVTTP